MPANTPFDIIEVGPKALKRYGAIPIAFTVESILRVEPDAAGLGGLTMAEEPVSEPYVKDYDALEPEPLTRWARRFDISDWGFFLAVEGGGQGGRERDIGGATVAWNSPMVNMLAGRKDLAVLWDIRVHPDHRGRGVGTALFRRAARWARDHECALLKIETQNVNVAACRFYAAQGCRLGAIDRHAYTDPRVAHEAMLIWYLDLGELRAED